MKASSMYPQEKEKVHDREWVKSMGFAPSIMDYARFDYVAQPEDKLDVADLVPRVGPYDVWAIGWGYRPIPGVKTADDEKPLLDRWARQQDQRSVTSSSEPTGRFLRSKCWNLHRPRPQAWESPQSIETLKRR